MITKQFSREDIAALTINHLSEIPPLEPIIIIDESLFAIKGGLSMVTGKTGSGKSTVLRIILSLALMPSSPPHWFDSLKMTVTPANGKPVIYINTEMPDSSVKRRVHDAVLKDVQAKQTPDNFITIQALGLGIEERRSLIRSVLECFKDIHLLVIDGGADTVTSVNDEQKSVEAIEELNRLANHYKTTIINVVHENKGNGLTRGHYGQHCERKATGIISIKYDSSKKHFSVNSGKTRETADFNAIHFAYDQDGNIYQLDQPVKRDDEPDPLLELVQICFKDRDRWKREDLVKFIKDTEGVTARTAQRKVKDMFAKNYVTSEGTGYVKCLEDIERLSQMAFV